MVKTQFLRRFPLALLLLTTPIHARDSGTAALVGAVAAEPAVKAPVPRGASDGAIITRRDARAITLKIPAPRGMIVDRIGEPIAQNKVVYQVALQYRQFENADRDFVINWARTRLDALQSLVKDIIPKTDDELYDHYRHRRWLPLYVTSHIGEKEAREIESKLAADLVLTPIYSRYYPHGELAAHIIGYSGSVGKLPTGPINFNEPLWEETEGRAGFEKLFDKQLTGDPGMKKLIFDESGNKLLEEQVKRPRPGGTLVTTINLKWQMLAEKTLREGCRRGAFVVIDAITGEVLVMASRPSFDPNMFAPGISAADFTALTEDPANPLHGRAFRSMYPPASSFKIMVALAALNNGVVTENSTIYCPPAIAVGNKVFNNWTKVPEGSINVKRAIARSCNTWFYQIGLRVGPHAFLDVARRLGFGSTSGLPLIGETPGIVPNDAYMRKVHKRRILDGDTANMSIGQGDLLTSPLQVAQAMAGVANGGALPKLQLIRQVQDTRGRVVQAFLPERRNWLGLDSRAVEIVREGMHDVVNVGGGTAQRAKLKYTTVCGKTGTGQWGPEHKVQRVGWFAGFLSYENPRYAFAVLYEGQPNEKVSGGRTAAPMVQKFFEGIEDDIKDAIAPPQKALIVVDEASGETVDPAAVVPDEINPDTEGFIRKPGNDAPLKALPVEPFETESEGGSESQPDPMDEASVEPPLEPRPIRAIPVGDDEVIEEGVDEP